MILTRLSPGAGRRSTPTAIQGRILYVEDDDAVWRVTERCLRGKFDLHRAADSAGAFELVAHGSFNLILLDIELAGSTYDGIEICRILRGTAAAPLGFRRPMWLDSTVPIVFVTAYTGRYPREELLGVGANEVVGKPVDYTRLVLLSSRLIVSGLRDSTGQGIAGR